MKLEFSQFLSSVFFAEEMAGAAIAMMVVSVFTKIYTDSGGPGLSIYRPQCPPGFCILGDYAQEGDVNKPNHGVMLCAFMQSDSRMVLKAHGFTQVWSSEGPASGDGYYSGDDDEEGSSDGSGAASGNSHVLAFWEPKVPSAEYVALGHVATTSYEPPSDSHVCVVHKTVATPGIPGKRLWIEESRMSSIWTLAPSYHYLNIDMFVSSDSRTAPRVNQFWSLSLDVVPPPQNTSLTIKKLNRDDLALIYQEKECVDSKLLSVYLPEAPIGYSSLGHYAEQGSIHTGGAVNVLIVKEKGGRGLLRNPVTYQELWRSHAKPTNTEAAIWRPVPPPGYFCLGHVLGLGLEPPSTKAVACLHWSVVGRVLFAHSKRVWWNKCSHQGQATIWRVAGVGDCLTAGTFVIHRGLQFPHWEKLLFHCFYQNEVPVK